ncbi:MAG: class I SAM-dependent methyltransferase [Patescibacteria group bacterium]
MGKITKREKLKEWSQINHLEYYAKRKLSPIVPDKKTLVFHRNNLKIIKGRFKNPKALILGVTPELRDLALKEGFEVIACDMNLEMIKKTQQLVKVKDRAKETIIKSNWLSVPLKNNSFHIILSDIAINNLSFKDFPKIFSLMAKWLVPGGYLSLKEVVYPDNGKFNNFEKNVKLFREGKFTFNNFYLRGRFLNFKKQVYNPLTKINDAKKVFEQFKKAYQIKIINKEEFTKLWRLKNYIFHTIVKQKEFIKLISKYFKLIDVKQSDSDKYDFYPVKLFIAKRK